MRVFCALALAALAGTTPAADDKRDDAAADLKAMVGKWKTEKAELGGKDILAVFKSATLEIREGGKYTVTIGEQKDEGTVTIDTSKKPREMDIKSTEGPNKGKTLKTIYKLDGDTLTVCYELGDGDRPTKFETKPDTKQFLAVYTREKK